MPYKQKYSSVAKMKSPYAKLGHSDSVAMQIKEPKTGEKQDAPEVVVTGDISKVGAFGKQLDKAFSTIESTISGGGFGSSKAQSEAGLGYGTSASKELERLKKMREKEGAPATLRYMRKRSRGTSGGTMPGYLNMPS
tara:strand:+ start:578 stop:988 length:411 start_codon:yes stop_codon:yes gene_type:complete